MEKHLDRIATAFERIADSIEGIREIVESEGFCPGEITANLQGPLCIQHEFHQDIPIGLLHVQPNERAFKVELSNCTDTEFPFAVQIND